MASSPNGISYITSIQRLDHLVNTHYLEVPPKVIQELGGTLKVRLLCTISNKLTFQCGLVALGNGSGYLTLTKKRMQDLGLTHQDQVEVTLEKDYSTYGTPMPEELAEVLLQDPEGAARFHLLKDGMKRYVLKYVAGVKSSQLRIDRALLLVTNLKRLHPGKETFKELVAK
ncbi:hypothetical protein TH61_16820 [Rufibacter sp. DG15C]|uniref:DUF1905 domain-containing protein n=1 Tax=Rufibacter sp. DG15C TaxID=1379909 RepID=UPI00078CECA9|nr:YdeI/OmpD-associated family protein [Rufibacter sp. DG15C]AMM52509.1 hypothetical protein TH61_16820 [Rufibacter sp. DG15C]